MALAHSGERHGSQTRRARQRDNEGGEERKETAWEPHGNPEGRSRAGSCVNCWIIAEKVVSVKMAVITRSIPWVSHGLVRDGLCAAFVG